MTGETIRVLLIGDNPGDVPVLLVQADKLRYEPKRLKPVHPPDNEAGGINGC